MYKVIFAWGPEDSFQSDDIRECIKFMKDNELEEYHDHLEYRQSCAENYERAADFYPTYYLEFEGTSYDITDIHLLERILNERGE